MLEFSIDISGNSPVGMILVLSMDIEGTAPVATVPAPSKETRLAIMRSSRRMGPLDRPREVGGLVEAGIGTLAGGGCCGSALYRRAPVSHWFSWRRGS